jgi:hypothetical protein
MCGRYVRRSDKQRIAEHFHVHGPSVPDFGESFNVAPQTFQPVIRLNRDSGEREIVLMRWGLIPFWDKNAKIGLSTINARAETVATAPAFREAFKTRRCLLRMAEDRCEDEAAIRDRHEGWLALRSRRSLGALARSRDKGTAGDVHGHHDGPKRAPRTAAQQDAGDHPAEGLSPMADARRPAASACRSLAVFPGRTDDHVEGGSQSWERQERHARLHRADD